MDTQTGDLLISAKGFTDWPSILSRSCLLTHALHLTVLELFYFMEKGNAQIYNVMQEGFLSLMMAVNLPYPDQKANPTESTLEMRFLHLTGYKCPLC